jgi:hypothetical protein
MICCYENGKLMYNHGEYDSLPPTAECTCGHRLNMHAAGPYRRKWSCEMSGCDCENFKLRGSLRMLNRRNWMLRMTQSVAALLAGVSAAPASPPTETKVCRLKDIRVKTYRTVGKSTTWPRGRWEPLWEYVPWSAIEPGDRVRVADPYMQDYRYIRIGNWLPVDGKNHFQYHDRQCMIEDCLVSWCSC